MIWNMHSRRRMKIVKTQLKVHTIMKYVIYDVKLHSRRRMKIVKTQLKVHAIMEYVMCDVKLQSRRRMKMVKPRPDTIKMGMAVRTRKQSSPITASVEETRKMETNTKMDVQVTKCHHFRQLTKCHHFRQLTKCHHFRQLTKCHHFRQLTNAITSGN